jgi:regulator of protease activity HflC (stomatin/prohibitin superfamily)
VQQLNVRVETKTLDNVFLEAVVSVQYQVLRDKCYEAFYALTNPVQQITAHVYDVCNYTCLTADPILPTAFSHGARFLFLQVMRSQLPTLELDSVFEAKEELAVDVKNSLTETMTSYGYQIVQVSSLCFSRPYLRGNLCSLPDL